MNRLLLSLLANHLYKCNQSVAGKNNGFGLSPVLYSSSSKLNPIYGPAEAGLLLYFGGITIQKSSVPGEKTMDSLL